MNNAILLFVEDMVTDEKLRFADTNCIELIAKRASSLASDLEIFYSIPSDYSGALSESSEALVRSGNITEDWKTVFAKTGADTVVRIKADSPFVDFAIVGEMLQLHTDQLAEYTYSENVPDGFCCDIISKELIISLPEQKDEDQKVLPLKSVIKSNINQFDVELYYKAPDIRQKRLSFCTAHKRERAILENIYRLHGDVPSYLEIESIIQSKPEVLYTSPSYVELELSCSTSFETIYSYRKALSRDSGNMEFALFSKIFTELEAFNIPYSICLGGSGDPLQHPELYKVLDLILSSTLVENLVIETDGTQVDTNFINYLEDRSDERVKIIAECNGYNSETYQKIHQVDLFEQVEKNLTSLSDTIGKSLYVQIMKINETEPFLDAFYDFWEQKNVTILLQKQNSYLGLIEDRRYYDLTPLERIPCWHLQRDLTIFADGHVPYCKQDINGKFSSHTASTMSISDIWTARKDLFLRDYKGDYPNSPACSSCDEWFTFNL